MTAVEFKQVSKTWGSTTALQPTELELGAGEFSVLLGPSGCGKTTTLRLIAGLETPSTGTIRIFGDDVTHAPPAARGVSMVFQNYALFPHLSVQENVAFGLKIRKTEKGEIEERLSRVLDLLGLGALRERKPSQLSGGQQQRVALARALVADARLCLMDEPLSNLDAKLRQSMREELRALQQKLELSLVYVTHDQTEAMSMADRVVLLRDGKIEQIASPTEIYQQPASLFVAQFIGSTKMNVLPVRDKCIESTDVTVSAPENAVSLGIRPEDISFEGSVDATVTHTEFTGADLLVHMQVGHHPITARADGKAVIQPHTQVKLGWQPSSQHWFDAQGLRIS
ncbi:ABC transporter ATP-binding protein [Orrella daihaiensis]|uniref:ABC transporter ATP-binding protein n=1 Tax=Orrella daihaiensis TaxID=2782176 RepID=A0ABY4ALG5_9BURK|nr:ABC transporter ATP-binding protein [Orrella daihaiensis]UOD49912.1 ABC transporter ATP-binding protein [Orrella daihaiensis]